MGGVGRGHAVYYYNLREGFCACRRARPAFLKKPRVGGGRVLLGVFVRPSVRSFVRVCLAIGPIDFAQNAPKDVFCGH